MPGHPASAWSTLFPDPMVRPAVALQAVSPMGMIVPAVPGYCSTWARAAAAARTSTAAAHHAIVRMYTPPVRQLRCAAVALAASAPRARARRRPARPASLDLPAASCRVPGTMEVLAGDVGGTKTLLAIAEVGELPGAGAPSIELRESCRDDSRPYPGLGAFAPRLARGPGRPPPAPPGLAAPGPGPTGGGPPP